MMKRIVLCVAALAILTSVASASVVQFNILNNSTGSGTTSEISISSGGDYVAGYGYNTTLAYAFPVYWSTDLNGGTAPVNHEVTGGWGAGTLKGIDKKAGGTLWTAANAGSTVFSANNFTGRYGTPMLQGGLKDHLGGNSMTTVGNGNVMRATPTGDAAWICGSWYAGNSKGADGQIWLTSDANFPTASYHPTHSSGTTVNMQSIAQNGNAVGQAKDAIGQTGATGRPRGVYWTTANTGAVLNIPTFANNGVTTEAQPYGVSNNGTYFSGLAYQNNNAFYRAFRWTIGDANSEMLTTYTGYNTSTYVVSYAIADDGTASGSCYSDDQSLPGGLAGAHDTATIWLPGQTVGTRVIDALIAAGVYDSHIRALGRAYGVTLLSDGNIAISGEGTYWLDDAHSLYGTRAWFAVIPEPATIGFLALGGLALLRRRR